MENEKYIPTIDELIELPELEDVQISPDGQYVAFTVSKPDWKKISAFHKSGWSVQHNHNLAS